MQANQDVNGGIRDCGENSCTMWQQCADLRAKTLDWKKSTGGIS